MGIKVDENACWSLTLYNSVYLDPKCFQAWQVHARQPVSFDKHQMAIRNQLNRPASRSRTQRFLGSTVTTTAVERDHVRAA